MGQELNRTGEQWDRSVMGRWEQWDRGIMGHGYNGTGCNGTGEQWDRSAMGRGHTKMAPRQPATYRITGFRAENSGSKYETVTRFLFRSTPGNSNTHPHQLCPK